jgi:hypothetical protein
MINKVAFRLIFLALACLFLAGVVAGSSGCAALKIKASVAGYVYQNNKAMPNWEVQLVQGKRVVRSEKTNQQGHFLIQGVPPGEYSVLVLNFAGYPYQGYEGHIIVRPGRTEVFDVELGDVEELGK